MRPIAAILLASILLAATALLPSDAARELADNSKKGGSSTSAPPSDGGFFPWGGFGFGNNWFPGFGDFKIPTSTVCEEKGPCYKKKLICPKKCFHSWGKNGNGGGGGSCNLDCTKCVATC